MSLRDLRRSCLRAKHGTVHGYGQAAGTAAALCAGTGAQPRDLDTSMLRERLIDDGAIVDPVLEGGPKQDEGIENTRRLAVAADNNGR